MDEMSEKKKVRFVKKTLSRFYNDDEIKEILRVRQELKSKADDSQNKRD